MSLPVFLHEKQKLSRLRELLFEAKHDYFGCGAGWAGDDCEGAGVPGVAGADFVWFGKPCRTDFDPVWREAKMESVMEVTMNMTADQVVALDKALAAPRGPNAVWLPIPPNAAAMSPLLPLCSSTTMMMKKQTRMWMMVISVIMSV
jgi:hypothetical protein